MPHELHFVPLPLLKGAHRQTIYGWVFGLPVKLASVMIPVMLPDGDQIALEISTPHGWKPTDRTALILHGLCGSHESPMIVRIAKNLHDQGWRTVRMNMRGAGSGVALAKQCYHSGRSADLLPVLQYLKGGAPESPITLIAYSLGGNVALKFAGEDPDTASSLVDHLIALCPPTDLLASSRMFMAPENRVYQKHFLKLLLWQLGEQAKFFPEKTPLILPKNISLFEFDQLFTAKQNGYDGALHYYSEASSCHVVPNITIPTKILYAADDPFVDWTALNGSTLPNNVELRLTRYGGHMGFLGVPGSPGGYRWMDTQVTAWATRGPQ